MLNTIKTDFTKITFYRLPYDYDSDNRIIEHSDTHLNKFKVGDQQIVGGFERPTFLEATFKVDMTKLPENVNYAKLIDETNNTFEYWFITEVNQYYANGAEYRFKYDVLANNGIELMNSFNGKEILVKRRHYDRYIKKNNGFTINTDNPCFDYPQFTVPKEMMGSKYEFYRWNNVDPKFTSQDFKLRDAQKFMGPNQPENDPKYIPDDNPDSPVKYYINDSLNGYTALVFINYGGAPRFHIVDKDKIDPTLNDVVDSTEFFIVPYMFNKDSSSDNFVPYTNIQSLNNLPDKKVVNIITVPYITNWFQNISTNPLNMVSQTKYWYAGNADGTKKYDPDANDSVIFMGFRYLPAQKKGVVKHQMGESDIPLFKANSNGTDIGDLIHKSFIGTNYDVNKLEIGLLGRVYNFEFIYKSEPQSPIMLDMKNFIEKIDITYDMIPSPTGCQVNIKISDYHFMSFTENTSITYFGSEAASFLAQNKAYLDSQKYQVGVQEKFAIAGAYSGNASLTGFFKNMVNPFGMVFKGEEARQSADAEKNIIQSQIDGQERRQVSTHLAGADAYKLIYSEVQQFTTINTIKVYIPPKHIVDRISKHYNKNGYESYRWENINGDRWWETRQQYDYFQMEETMDYTNIGPDYNVDVFEEFVKEIKSGIRIWHPDRTIEVGELSEPNLERIFKVSANETKQNI